MLEVGCREEAESRNAFTASLHIPTLIQFFKRAIAMGGADSLVLLFQSQQVFARSKTTQF
jgi:hypothetical protein